MCDLYGVTTNQEAIRRLFPGGLHDRAGNMPPLPGVFPDYMAPIVRNAEGGRELVMARWGMPSPRFVLNGKKTDPGVTNIRNAGSPHWRRWLGVEHRCLVPFTSFSENEVLADGARGRGAGAAAPAARRRARHRGAGEQAGRGRVTPR